MKKIQESGKNAMESLKKRKKSKNYDPSSIRQPGARAVVQGWRDSEFQVDPLGSWTGNTAATNRGEPPQIPQQDADDL